jgi:hypothetical protein
MISLPKGLLLEPEMPTASSDGEVSMNFSGRSEHTNLIVPGFSVAMPRRTGADAAEL